jgi:recombinational DNA repair protein RecT
VAQNQQNQTDGEYFAVVETGRRGMEQALDAMHDELMAVAAAPVQQQGDTWKQRALAYVTGNESLRDVLGHKRGIWSVYQSLAQMAQLGLQPGGHFPHAYLVPFAPQKGAKKLAQPIITAEGYLFAAKHGPQAVIDDATYAAVREGDSIGIDQAKGEVSHQIDPLSERGKVLGVWVRIMPLKGSPQVKWYSRDDLIAVRDKRSLSWRFDQKNSPWATDEEAMMVKTAVKRALKPWAAEAEGLAMLYSDDEEPMPPAQERAERDVTDRAGHAVDSMLGVLGEEPEGGDAPDTTEQAMETGEAAQPESQTGGDAEQENDLF